METKFWELVDLKGPQRENEIKIGMAADIIRNGGLVGLPTETVYGLGANGLDPEAVKKIFEVKGRPQDNPLILHVPGVHWLPRYCKNVPPIAYELARRFWPGPLTMILERNKKVPDRTTAGLDTVGIRCPAHLVTLAIIRESGVPIAAPSANTSGRPSCTTAADVMEDMNGKINGVVDGGPCDVGVESTILDLTTTPPRLLRPGGLPLEEIERVVGSVELDSAIIKPLSADEKPKAPGMKYRHYAPKAPVTVITGSPRQTAHEIVRRLGPTSGVICFDEYADLFNGHETQKLGSVDDKATQAQRVFDALRAFDSSEVTEIFAQCPDSKGLGLAVGNRLKKAAGFQIIEVSGEDVVLGITGGTGAGKTSALRALEALGGKILDCDAVYYEMLRTNTEMRRVIGDSFGDVFLPDGTLDRKKLGAVVFNDPDRLNELNAIVFRFMRPELNRRMVESPCKLYGLDAISLVESGVGKLCDKVIAITSPAEIRVRRIMARDSLGEQAARMRIAAQKPDSFFRKVCDYELQNTAESAEEFKGIAEKFFTKIIDNIKEEKANGREK